ncbi:hypothetical protein RAS12_07710 [Achromobacter seleniivolatilans]|uniref:Uncharacterized protein n=1 Tax=Achromobacter seleniivolatilans TaxID=3047478 RepID=A0ABY9M5I9_9BURK|nr:hypothetical protein [Achromobacter sp. R39]WMD22256.1 hypothetical protein RAS12_07710 [Achromobacter sp. R39]
MALFGKKFSVGSLKDAVGAAKEKLEEGASSLKDVASSLGGKAVDASANAVTAVRNVDYAEAQRKSKAAAIDLANGAKDMTAKVVDTVREFDFDDAKTSAVNFSKESAGKLHQYFRSTFEVDKSTFDMVQDIRGRLPAPAKSMDDIYDQCRNEAVRRAIAAFMLGGILDQQAQAKYDKLTDDYDFYRKDRYEHMGNYGGMKPARDTPDGTVFANGYNPDEPLVYERSKGTTVTVDHITSRKEIFADTLLKIGLTDEQFGAVVNDPGNLKYMHRSINSQKNDQDVYSWLAENSRPHPTDDGKLIATIAGTKAEHIIDKKAVDDAYAESKKVIRAGHIQAVKEISTTVALTGATMAAQQVVGLIVVETIDVFMDELKRVKLISSDGLVNELKESKERISAALSERFEERQIWARAKSLGIEAGVAGALSVIPQILISLILKMPAFVYAIIRESTLSVVRSVRVLVSNDPDKLASLQVIMLGTASAIAGVYVQRVISQGIASVPLLNKFNAQVSGILSGMMITAIPLAAIYTFDQNRKALVLKLKG